MTALLFLVLFPLVPAVLLLAVKHDGARGFITRLAVAVIAGGCIGLPWLVNPDLPAYFSFDGEWVGLAMFVIEIFLAGLIFYLGIKYKRYLASVLIALQFGLMAWYEFSLSGAVSIQQHLFLDRLSFIMALIIGVIGGLICIYALGYMRDFHRHHHEMKDRRPFFFFVLFVFLSAMFGLVFAGNLVWLFFFWEITTLCSFLLIGYTKTPEATANAFKALIMNLFGGLAFAGAIVWLAATGGPLDLKALIASPQAAVMIPVSLLCFAGITKSAQMPFSSWLLGAMVAPTPTSALLHSSTMVKAGVYLVLRLAPVMAGSYVGAAVALVGGVTFLLAAFIAISQSNAKKVLAYSTVSNLGLIITCAGVGTAAAVWAGIFLIIFHAVAKSLLFLCVGTLEHRIGSRDIEDMDNILIKMPTLAVMVLIGIGGMFVAPFGMLISKWAAIRAFVQAGPVMSPILILLLAYGSAVTVFFWTKWMAKIMEVSVLRTGHDPLEDAISYDERFAHWAHTVLTVGICLAFPLVSGRLVEPYVAEVFGQAAGMEAGNLILTGIMVALILILPTIAFPYQRKAGYVFGTAYMAGRNEYPDRMFDGSLAQRRKATLKNYYLAGAFGEEKFMKVGVLAGTCLLALMLGAALL